MAITNVHDGEKIVQDTRKTNAYPLGSVRFDLTAALLSLWMLAGLYLDGSAHHHIPDLIETFFTPWHAVLYSGFLASTGLLLITQWRNVSSGYHSTRSLPKGYVASLVGAVISLFSRGVDFLWYEAFGFEVGLEALVSPSHLALAVGGVVMISGPLRLFAFSVPAILFALFFVILITTAGTWWSVHLWTGAVFLSGVVGLLLSYLIVPPSIKMKAVSWE